jgi:regulatory protein PHO2
MEIPFSTIVDTEFVNAAPGSGLASFFLTRPPLFYLEDLVAPPTGGPPVRSWKRCADWTEGMQASKILRHDLVGSAVQLAHVIRNLQAQAALPSSDVRLRSGPYMRSDLASGQSLDTNSITLAPSLSGQTHGYRPPFGGSAVDTGREEMVTDAQKRFSFPGVHPQPVNAPSDATTFGDPLGTSPHSHLGLTDSSSSSSPVVPYPSYPPLSATSSSSNYSSISLFPIAVPLQRSHSHLGNYPDVSSPATPGQSSSPPYLGQQGQAYHIPAPPASAPPSHTHFELAPTPPPPSLAPQPPQQQHQQQYQRHQPTSQMLGQPSIPVPLPFGNGFDTSGHRGE